MDSSYTCTCPICGSKAGVNSSNCPFEMVDIQCNNCGFYTSTQIGRLSLADILELKQDEIVNSEEREFTDEDKKNITENYNSFKESDFDIY